MIDYNFTFTGATKIPPDVHVFGIVTVPSENTLGSFLRLSTTGQGGRQQLNGVSLFFLGEVLADALHRENRFKAQNKTLPVRFIAPFMSGVRTVLPVQDKRHA